MSTIEEKSLIKEHPILVSLDGTKKILSQMENCICKININDGSRATGFFCKIPFNHYLLPVLITNHSVLNENDKIISLTINNKDKIIKLDNSRKKYMNLDNNISIIEIKPNKDKIYNYLEIDEKLKNDAYKNEPIYMLHYPYVQVISSFGLINDIIDNKTIKHCCSTDVGSSGSPILLLNTLKVIGVHYGCPQNKKFNNGTFIKYAIDEFDKYNKNENENEINIIYKTNEEGIENIFGEKFVENKRIILN